MNSWFQHRPVAWDTTAPRILAVVGRADLLFRVTGLTVPRVVADPTDPDGDRLLEAASDRLSELAAAEQHFRTRHRRLGDPADYDRSLRLAAVRGHRDLRVVDLSEDELDDMDVLASRGIRARLGHGLPLGRGERATIAMAAGREMTAGLDDKAAREAAKAFGVPTMTTQDLLRAAVAELITSDREAEDINRRMLRAGFRGDAQL